MDELPGNGRKDRAPFPRGGRGQVLRCLKSDKVTVESLKMAARAGFPQEDRR